jgi:hypothetical protein
MTYFSAGAAKTVAFGSLSAMSRGRSRLVARTSTGLPASHSLKSIALADPDRSFFSQICGFDYNQSCRGGDAAKKAVLYVTRPSDPASSVEG